MHDDKYDATDTYTDDGSCTAHCIFTHHLFPTLTKGTLGMSLGVRAIMPLAPAIEID